MLNIVTYITDQDNQLSLWLILILRIFLLIRHFDPGAIYTRQIPLNFEHNNK